MSTESPAMFGERAIMGTPRLLIGLVFLLMGGTCHAQQAEAILGIWKSDEKAFVMEFYRSNARYNAKIVSFTDHHSTLPQEQRTDERNPDKKLRGRKLLGLNVITGLNYNGSSHSWEGGKIYNANSGKTYDASATIEDGKLLIRGFKGLSLFGKTLTFHR